MKLWLKKHGIYEPTICLDWRFVNWWKIYGRVYYDWWWHVIRIGPICFNWNTFGKC